MDDPADRRNQFSWEEEPKPKAQREMADSPGEGLLLDLDREYHVDARICVKRSEKQSLSQVYSLSGQRSTTTVTRNKALSLLGIANYECLLLGWGTGGQSWTAEGSGKSRSIKEHFRRRHISPSRSC